MRFRTSSVRINRGVPYKMIMQASTLPFLKYKDVHPASWVIKCSGRACDVDLRFTRVATSLELHRPIEHVYHVLSIWLCLSAVNSILGFVRLCAAQHLLSARESSINSNHQCVYEAFMRGIRNFFHQHIAQQRFNVSLELQQVNLRRYHSGIVMAVH